MRPEWIHKESRLRGCSETGAGAGRWTDKSNSGPSRGWLRFGSYGSFCEGYLQLRKGSPSHRQARWGVGVGRCQTPLRINTDGPQTPRGAVSVNMDSGLCTRPGKAGRVGAPLTLCSLVQGTRSARPGQLQVQDQHGAVRP